MSRETEATLLASFQIQHSNAGASFDELLARMGDPPLPEIVYDAHLYRVRGEDGRRLHAVGKELGATVLGGYGTTEVYLRTYDVDDPYTSLDSFLTQGDVDTSREDLQHKAVASLSVHPSLDLAQYPAAICGLVAQVASLRQAQQG